MSDAYVKFSPASWNHSEGKMPLLRFNVADGFVNIYLLGGMPPERRGRKRCTNKNDANGNVARPSRSYEQSGARLNAVECSGCRVSAGFLCIKKKKDRKEKKRTATRTVLIYPFSRICKSAVNRETAPTLRTSAVLQLIRQ